MKVRRILCALAALAVLTPVAARSQSPDSAAMMQKWQEYMTPGPAHQALAKQTGDWTWELTSWPAPGAPAQKSSGTMSARTIMGGRYLVEDWKGTAMEMPFEGQAVTGYDNAKKKYFSTWVDNFGTGIMTSWGTRDDAKRTMTMSGTFTDPMSGKDQTTRSVSREVDDNHFTFEMYGPGPDGKEYKTMEIQAERKS
ncbi:MAG TPA: DUF1579 domain-containing protein [Gemmatimonadota bacterium]|jgi:hypothetical protein